MPRLISPGVSVDVEDRSLFTSGRAGTVPLILIATADEKVQLDGETPAIGTYEHGVLRTVTSVRQATELYGIPRYLYSADGRPHHGDVRNEYGLDALVKVLEISDRAYVIRANVNLNDDPEFIKDMWDRKIVEANDTLEALFAEWLRVENETLDLVEADANYVTDVPADVTEVLIRQALSSVFGSYSFSKDNFEAAFLDDTTGATVGYADVFYTTANGFITDLDVTGLEEDQVYVASVEVNGTSVPLIVNGADAQTFGEFTDLLADQLTGFATVDFFLGRIRISSTLAGVTSTVKIIDGGSTTSDLRLFGSTNLFTRIGTPVNGRGPGGYALYDEDYTNILTGQTYTGLLSELTATRYTYNDASSILLTSAVAFMKTKEFLFLTSLGATDAERRAEVVRALRELALDPRTEIRTDGIDYDLLVCPGFPELGNELSVICDSVLNEVFVIGETPFNIPPTGPDGVTTWGRNSTNRIRNRDFGYWYGHGLSSNLDGRPILTTSAAVALRTICFSDRETDVFYAPAGIVRGRADYLSDVGYVSGTLGGPTTFVRNLLDRGTRDSLYEFPVNINPITFEVGAGIIVYGQKTSQGFESSLDRINVSRLVKRMKRILRRSLRPFVFEPNDQITRDLVKASVSGYLSTLLGRRALNDFAVQCDERNNTPQTIQANELYVDIAIKPTTAVEFIYARIIVVRQDADISNFG